ncbi:hypothetical protein I3842_14G130000 [Carya illinoinensis]|uniref:Uncharacterized protein n=1 Tax=Carya illinoinensis TaxID=32201 RepID=A0A922ALT2_CARIL|nr:hypothetical protein I3842_14G130000 [Carya illinoinensis]
MIETSDLTGAPNLEKINLTGCRSLCEVHPSIGVLKRLQEIKNYIPGIKQLWKGSAVLHNLKELDLSYFENMIETPDLTGAPNLEKINLTGCRNLCEVHSSIGVLERLKELRMSGTRIKQLSMGMLVVLHNLRILDLNHSKNLIETPDLS